MCQKPTGIDFLFGDDLPKYVKDISDEKKAVMACTKSEILILNYGSKRFHPYNNYTPSQHNYQQRRSNRPVLGNREGISTRRLSTTHSHNTDKDRDSTEAMAEGKPQHHIQPQDPASRTYRGR